MPALSDHPTAIPLPSATPEAVAFRLMELIGAQEGKHLALNPMEVRKETSPDRAWILATYAKCLQVVRTAYHEG